MMNTLIIIFGLLAFFQVKMISSEISSPAIVNANQIEEVPNPNETTNDVLKFGTNVMNTLSEKVNTLPEHMKPAGQDLLADAKEGLRSCESNFMRNGIAWEYKVCCNSYLKYGMSAFGNLAAQSYRSGVSSAFVCLWMLIVGAVLNYV